MKAYLVKYTVQEKDAYIVGFLDAYLNPRDAQHAIAETGKDLLARGWQVKEDAAKDSPIASYSNSKLHRVMQLYIQPIEIKEGRQ